MTDRFRSERYAPDQHDVSTFSCGEESLDIWIREQALASAKRGTARTWVWSADDGRVVGYYALAAHKVARERVPSRLARGGPQEVPAVLLAKLALSREFQGRGLGAVLAADAMTRVIEATQTVAARLVVVDALHEKVAQFYETLGFRRIPGSLMLVQRIADVEAAIASR